jgi:hypothetical protein
MLPEKSATIVRSGRTRMRADYACHDEELVGLTSYASIASITSVTFIEPS